MNYQFYRKVPGKFILVARKGTPLQDFGKLAVLVGAGLAPAQFFL